MLKQMDWGVGDPSGAGLLPIMPFFGGAQPTMFALEGPPVDPSAGPPSGLFQMAGIDPLTAPPAGLFQMPAVDPTATFAVDPSANAASATSATTAGPAGASGTASFPTPAIGPSAMLAAGPSTSLTQGPPQQTGSEAFADSSAPSSLSWPGGARPMPDPNTGMTGTDGQPLTQPAVLTNWGDSGAQDGAFPAVDSVGPAAPSLMLAAQQRRPGSGSPRQPPFDRLGPPPTGPTSPPGAVRTPAQASDPLHAEYAFQATINQVFGSGKLAPDKAQILQNYATRVGRPLNPRALTWVMQNAGNPQAIGNMKPGEILSLAHRGVRLRNRLIKVGITPPAAAAVAANAMGESFGYFRSPQLSGGNGHGLFQWNPVRRAEFEKQFGKKFSDTTEDDQIRFAAWEMQHDRLFQPSWAVLHSDQSTGAMAKVFALNYERMANKKGDPEARAAIAEVLNMIPVDPRMNLAPPSSPPPEVEAFLRRQAAKARSVRR
jgi:hypothetical protein